MNGCDVCGVGLGRWDHDEFFRLPAAFWAMAAAGAYRMAATMTECMIMRVCFLTGIHKGLPFVQWKKK